MKLYFDLNDICDVQTLLDHIDQDSRQYSDDIGKMFYAFAAQYAAHTLRAIINGAAGDNFVTYVPVKPQTIFSQMAGCWSRRDMTRFHMCFDSIDLSDVVRFNNVVATVDHALLSAGKTISMIKDGSQISLDLSNPGGTLICLEC